MKQPKEPPVQRHILVTGGAGYLGSVLVPELLRQGHRVRVVDALYFGEESLQAVKDNPHLEIICEDIVHQENVSGLFENIDTVVHLASISNDPSCDLDPNLSIQTNFLATMSLARRSQAEGVRQFIFSSSCSVYGASGSRYLNETSRTGPITLYALTKLEAERELLRLATEEFSVTVLRLATLFGLSPRMRFDLAVNGMTKFALQEGKIVVNGSGEQYRPFVHVHDAADAIRQLIMHESSKTNGQVFNVGHEDLNYTIQALADQIRLAFPDIGIEHRFLQTDVRSYRVRFEKIRKVLGFAPQRTILDGVREIVEAHQQGLLEDMDDKRYYNVSVMKDTPHAPRVPVSLVSAPRWAEVFDKAREKR